MQITLGAFGGPGLNSFAEHLPHLPLLPQIVWAILAAGSELLGGGLALVGLFTRLAMIPLIVTMLVAIATVHAASGFSNTQSPPGYEYNLALIAIATTILLLGAGIVSLDALIFRRGLWAIGPQPLQGAKRRTP